MPSQEDGNPFWVAGEGLARPIIMLFTQKRCFKLLQDTRTNPSFVVCDYTRDSPPLFWLVFGGALNCSPFPSRVSRANESDPTEGPLEGAFLSVGDSMLTLQPAREWLRPRWKLTLRLPPEENGRFAGPTFCETKGISKVIRSH